MGERVGLMPTAAHQPKKPAWLATLIAALMAGVFLIDLATPLGVADGIAYLVPVLLTSWLRHRRSTVVGPRVGPGPAARGPVHPRSGVVREGNQVVVPAREETELLEQVWRRLVEEGGSRLAWVGDAEQDE